MTDSGLSLVCIVAGVLAGGIVVLVMWWRLQRRATRRAEALRAAISSLGTNGGDGSTALLALADRPVLDALAHVTATLRDRVATAEQERDVALSRVSDGVIVTDSHVVVQFVNRTQADRLKLPQQRLVGRSLIEVLHDHEVDEAARLCLSTGAEQRATVEVGPDKRYIRVSATPLGGGAGCVIVLQDRTEMRRLERVRREFVANISHELRTPLATLKLLSETLVLGDGEDPVIVKDYLGRIEVEVDRLAQMVDELGALSLIESGQVVLARETIHIDALVRRAVERLEAQASRSGLTVTVDVPKDLPQPRGDEHRLEQVLVNLLHNAIKFTPAGGRIRVFASCADGAVKVSVQDTGVGIAEDDLDRIFERFYKSDKSRSGTGTGLGLAIARHIVELHGGRIWAVSTEGKGATLSFTLPLASSID
jgi:two-component system phosphate regulon sensor histidine kinase PhoR